MSVAWSVTAVIAAALAVGLLVRSGRPRLNRLASPDETKIERVQRRRRLAWLPVLMSVPAAAYAIGGTRAAALGAAAMIVVVVVALLLGGRRSARAAQRRKQEVARACWALAGELRLGLVPATALTAAATDCSILAGPAAVARIGGDVVEALHRLGRTPGAGGMGAVARAWQVTSRTGAPMEPTLSAVARALREAVELDQLIAGELAAPRLTGRMLAVLPLFGMSLGYMIGGDPIGFLLDSPVGQACLVLGVSLAGAGVLWTEHLANQVVSRS